MRNLRLVGLSADGSQVVLVDDAGAEFATPADDRLRAALRGDRARLGQLEIEMESVLRPRDIQARIRAGDSPETVAVLAQVPVEKIMPYCIPVLAEREHIGELARRSHVRRRGAEGPSRALAEVTAERLRARGIDPRTVEWDAWRREDGRWAVQASYLSGERERTAVFAFDAVGRYSLADDDEARWLTGERQSTSKGPQPREGGHAGDRRLTAVPDDDLLSIADGDDSTDDLTAVVRAVRETDGEIVVEAAPDDDQVADVEQTTETARDFSDESEESDGAADEPTQTSFLDQALSRSDEGSPETARETDDLGEPGPADGAAEVTTAGNAADSSESEPARGATTETEPTPERRRRTKRASVPSWDEIMFGKDET